MNKGLMEKVRKTIGSEQVLTRQYCNAKETEEYKKMVVSKEKLPKGIRIQRDSDGKDIKFYHVGDLLEWTDAEIDRALNIANIEAIKRLDSNVSFIKWFMIVCLVVPLIIGILMFFIIR